MKDFLGNLQMCLVTFQHGHFELRKELRKSYFFGGNTNNNSRLESQQDTT